jgi:hypothetical protein
LACDRTRFYFFARELLYRSDIFPADSRIYRGTPYFTNWVAINPLKRFHLGFSETEMTLASDSEEVLKKRADASFRKEERVKEGTKAKLEYEAEERAVLKKTARLRALRLAKEAAEKAAKLATEPGKPARKKRAIRPIP